MSDELDQIFEGLAKQAVAMKRAEDQTKEANKSKGLLQSAQEAIGDAVGAARENPGTVAAGALGATGTGLGAAANYQNYQQHQRAEQVDPMLRAMQQEAVRSMVADKAQQKAIGQIVNQREQLENQLEDVAGEEEQREQVQE